MEGRGKNEDSAEANRNADFPIIVIGASSGGFDALKQLISKLPSDLHAAIFIVWHMSPTMEGVLPGVLNRYNALPATNAIDKEPILPKRIYVAPPDKHMLIEKGRILVTRGPKENRFRPAVDPLFRSAAFNYGNRVIGIILSGALDDGTAGLWAVKHFGGTTVTQDPNEAEVKGMPESALREVEVDHCLPINGIAELLRIWKPKQVLKSEVVEKNNKTETEIRIASENNAFAIGVMELGELTPFTCPECHGVLASIRDGNIKRYRCHTGHAFSTDSLLASITERIEENTFSAIRGIDESVLLLNHVGDHFAEKNETKLASYYFKKAKEAADRASILRLAVFGGDQLSEQKIKEDFVADKKKNDNQ
jgi:two-component system, chemotaxis family, protein-glutamate methylesterase/glutaminase